MASKKLVFPDALGPTIPVPRLSRSSTLLLMQRKFSIEMEASTPKL